MNFKDWWECQKIFSLNAYAEYHTPNASWHPPAHPFLHLDGCESLSIPHYHKNINVVIAVYTDEQNPPTVVNDVCIPFGSVEIPLMQPYITQADFLDNKSASERYDFAERLYLKLSRKYMPNAPYSALVGVRLPVMPHRRVMMFDCALDPQNSTYTLTFPKAFVFHQLFKPSSAPGFTEGLIP